MNVIKIELCTEDRERLDKILAALETLGQPMQVNELTGAIEPAEPTEPAPIEAPEGFEEIPAEPKPAPAPAPGGEAPKYTKADIQSRVVKLSAAGKKDAVRAIVNQHGAKVSDIPETAYAEVWAKLDNLEG